MLAINMPVTAILRESLCEKAYHTFFSNGTLSSVPFKMRIVNSYLDGIRQATGLLPSLNSDLTLTLTFTNDEFNVTDVEYLVRKCPDDFRVAKKRLHCGAVQDPVLLMYTKQRIANIAHKLDREYALSYRMASPSAPCTYTVAFERNPLFIAGRYLKFSRTLPQSPWSSSFDEPRIPGNSISEKIVACLIEETRCDSTRFMAAGREDIDLINPKKTNSFRRDHLQATLKRMENCINKNTDVRVVPGLRRISAEQSSFVKNDQDEKQKLYTGYCYSTQKLDDLLLNELPSKAPIELVQKTPVRVLKRRPLLERRRTVFSIAAIKLDDYHFLIRQAFSTGTYVKEFVHGDFGRTRPSLADLLGVECGEMDILELDVERVDMVWPPRPPSRTGQANKAH
ncbi:unnamed protein product [Gongylonema pulchrum]|uniref:tRNA pseudouridine(55) synthase n=1 Tax=Gongylonema pulchrum TaxID=637853 RepID=A0A3P7MX57_9BILA|nr:unnamed protein product [Gongylonema pulchrum]